ncbi:MAG: lipid asymmetry maintenance protein MlaB [Methylophilaceae bacterium]|nr:STAS domain-containing protein [Methyloradius sp.]
MANITQQENRWLITGAMTMPHICGLLDESTQLPMNKSFEIDLGEVTDVDTATISLLFEWLRSAHVHKSKLTFANFPENLVSLATLYGVLELLPQAAHSQVTH